jgi:hypothetical protein
LPAGERQAPAKETTMDTDTPLPTAGAPIVDIRHISTAQLASLGVSQIAYIKPVMVNGERAYAIHNADGTPMALANELEVAISAVNQHEMAAALTH